MRFLSPLSFCLVGLVASYVDAQETGDSFCSSVVCVSAVKTSSRETYTLTRPAASQQSNPGFGWIAIGWGTTMANSPMVILWPNENENSITLSQRTARAQVQPTEATLPGFARLEQSRSFINTTSLSSTSITFYFEDNSPNAVKPIIWAYSPSNPGSSSPGANILKHIDSGTTTLDLTKVIAGTVATATRGLNETATATDGTTAVQRTGKPTATTATLDAPRETRTVTGSNSLASTEPYTDLQKVLIAHATFGGLGTMIMIPLGVLVARILRSFWPKWVKAHYLVHIALSLPFITIAFGLGIHATNLSTGITSDHFWSSHRGLGLALFISLLFQIGFGTAIHVWPAAPHGKANIKGKSIQNWLHPVVGIAILLLGWATCWTGFDEWEGWSGLGEVPTGVKVVWGILLGLFALAYLAGLILLRRQFRQASELRATQGRESREMVLQPSNSPRDRQTTNSSTNPIVSSSSPIDDYKDRSYGEYEGKATTPTSDGGHLEMGQHQHQFSNERGFGGGERQRKGPGSKIGVAF